MKCEYEGCKIDVFENFNYCILHMGLPYDEKAQNSLK